MSFGPTMPPGSVFAAPSDPSVFRPRDASGWKPGMAMATAVHLLLVAALAMGVQWKIQPPAAVEAEVWTEVPRIDVPQPVAPVPPAPPEVTPPQPAPPPEPVAAEVPVEPKMDVAMIPVKPKVDKHKLSKAEKKQAKKQPKEEFIPDPPKKVPPKTPAKAEKVVAPPPKPVVDPKVAAKAAAKAEAEAQAKSKAEAESLAAQRRANLDKLMKTLAQDQISAAGPSESYIGRIVSRVKSNIVFPRDGVVGNPAALVKVECSSDGKITKSTVIAQSGNDSWDQAVIRALERTQILPLDEHKRAPCPFEINFRPNDF